MSADILSQVITNLQETQFFSLQLDESTDVSNCAQLIAYVRYIGDENIIDEFLFRKSLETMTRGEDIFRVLQNFFTEHNLDWSKLVSICICGVPSMIGRKSGFTARVSLDSLHGKRSLLLKIKTRAVYINHHDISIFFLFAKKWTFLRHRRGSSAGRALRSAFMLCIHVIVSFKKY